MDFEAIVLFVKEFGAYGLWGLTVPAFLIWGMPHVAPIIAAIGAIYNTRHKTNLAHERGMKKLQNKVEQDLLGKPKGK